jgi:hypothetical protein
MRGREISFGPIMTKISAFSSWHNFGKFLSEEITIEICLSRGLTHLYFERIF